MNKTRAILIVIVSIAAIEFLNNVKPKHPYTGLDITALVSVYGYPIENHEVVTDDGYILTLHRIPSGRSNNLTKRGPVLLMHGCAQSSTDFVALGPDRSLALLLADRGYDVWLGNARGSTWSKKHKILDPNETVFWDFRMHEIGLYDVPAFIDYILKITRQDSLHYIGYSQGTALFFILGSTRPEYIPKIKLMTALAPVIYLQNIVGPYLYVLAHSWKMQEYFYDYFYTGEVLSHDSVVSKILKYICNEHSLFVGLCLHFNFMLVGYNYDELDMSELSLIFSNRPAGAGPKQLLHIAQWMQSGEFHEYDFGPEENMKRYGQETPPRYDLSKITTPVALYYASNDRGINPENMKRVKKTLPNVVKSYKVPLNDFTHNDFINAKNVVDLVYREVMEEMSKY